MRPFTGRSSARASAINASASRGMTPAFCGSSPVFTWMKRSGHCPNSCARRAMVFASFGRSSVWIASANSIACRALLVCSGPIKCRTMSSYCPRKSGHLPAASCTLFSPKNRCPCRLSL